jgi:hypothetical protein
VSTLAQAAVAFQIGHDPGVGELVETLACRLR